MRVQAFMHGFLEDLLRCHNLTSQMSNDLKEFPPFSPKERNGSFGKPVS